MEEALVQYLIYVSPSKPRRTFVLSVLCILYDQRPGMFNLETKIELIPIFWVS